MHKKGKSVCDVTATFCNVKVQLRAGNEENSQWTCTCGICRCGAYMGEVVWKSLTRNRTGMEGWFGDLSCFLYKI